MEERFETENMNNLVCQPDLVKDVPSAVTTAEGPMEEDEIPHMTVEEVLEKFGADNVFISKFSYEDYEKAFSDIQKHRSNLSGSSPAQRDRLKNVLYSHIDLLENIYNEYQFQRRMIADMGEELDALYERVKQSDAEYNELNRKLKAAEASGKKSKKSE